MTLKTEIFITLTFEGFHRWEKAPGTVKFLSNYHRHLFHVKAWKVVAHSDRDIEFISFKQKVSSYCKEAYEKKEFEYSCEQIAMDLIDVFKLSRCEVSEDGENGALVTVEE